MPMDFLKKVEHETLPLAVTDPRDIRNVAVLVAAGLVEAILPQEGVPGDLPAVVLRITPPGRDERERLLETPQ